MNSSPDICMVIRSPIQRTPPSVYQAQMIIDRGATVSVLDIEDFSNVATPLPTEVTRTVVDHYSPNHSSRSLFDGVASVYHRSLYRTRALSALKTQAPRVLIAYDSSAFRICAHYARSANPRPKLIWHPHEYPEIIPGMSFGMRYDTERARHSFRDPDLIVFPDEGRRNAFVEEVGEPHQSAIVMNCPLLLQEVAKESLSTLLVEHGFDPTVRKVVYYGAIGQGHGIERVIDSMPEWPENSRFIMIGPCRDEYREALAERAAQLEVANRLILLGSAKPADLWSLRAGADLCINFYEPLSINYKYTAGASNKRFEAMATGVPQIANTGPGMSDIFEKSDAGILVNQDRPQEIAAAVNRLLSDEETRLRMGRSAREAHLSIYNYQAQYRDVLDTTMRWTTKRAPQAVTTVPGPTGR